MSNAVLAFDIGGANLKAAHSDGTIRFRPFELWKNPAGLERELSTLTSEMPPFSFIAVTMTGELCDCFSSKREGVRSILRAVSAVATSAPVRVYLTDGSFASLDEALEHPLRAAASNWLALAEFAGRFAKSGPALLIDVGSTTTDIIPLLDGIPIPQGRSDFERLRSRELVYSGVRRTPVCAILGDEAAAEWFATTHDVYILLGQTPEDEGDLNTADGRPATKKFAAGRLARMYGEDADQISPNEISQRARDIQDRQISAIVKASKHVCQRLPGQPETVIVSGSGEFLARKVIQSMPLATSARLFSLTDQLGFEISRAACAYALAVIASERIGDGD